MSRVFALAAALSLAAGAAPAQLALSGNANKPLLDNGTVSVFRIAEGRPAPVGTVEAGPAASGVSHVPFTPDGRLALVTHDGEPMVSVPRVDGERVTPAGRAITAGIRPYGLAITRDGRRAVAAAIGRGTGDAATVSLISLTREPFPTVDTSAAGPTPEGIQVSPDNRRVAVPVMNGSSRAANHPARGRSLLVPRRIEDGRLVRVVEAEMGSRGQGIACDADGPRPDVQNMVEREIQVRACGGQRLTSLPERVAAGGGPAAIRTVER